MEELKKLESQQMNRKVQAAARTGGTGTVGDDVSDDALMGMGLNGMGASGWEQSGNMYTM